MGDFTDFTTERGIPIGDGQKVEHFIIGASTAKDEVDYIGFLSCVTPSIAHDQTIRMYRKEFDFPGSRHIFTKTLYRSTNHAEAAELYNKLMAKLGSDNGD